MKSITALACIYHTIKGSPNPTHPHPSKSSPRHPMPHTGSCLCGLTAIELSTTEISQVLCHCVDCRRTSGSAFSGNILVPKKDVRITGPTKEYTSRALSGNMVTRVFCGTCGSAIAHRNEQLFGDTQVVLQTGNLEGFGNVPVGVEIFVKDRWASLPAVDGAVQVEGMLEF
ncbi:unnamed protein product [Mycena citricolor]|uniref:CENP-V/GFA domain-containing protein n=1 Tax=Mycena citricolor TaxID=2018698 RepID=A0AAD2HXJ0_9AGAR|nr:unnamed protein product [Mycena citricolor]